MFCFKCGAEVPEGSAFCQKCGVKLQFADTAPQLHNTANTNLEGNISDVVQTTTPTDCVTKVKPDFKAFVDRHVQATTSFQTAEELLNSQVPQKFMRVCFGIPAIFAVILFIRSPSFSSLLGSAFLGFVFGYLASLMADSIIGARKVSDVEIFSGEINTDALIQFLNEHMNYLSPYFHKWEYFTFSNKMLPGLRGVMMARALNDVTASSVKIGTGFGRKQLCTIAVWIEPDKSNPGSGQTTYYFEVMSHNIWPVKHTCRMKGVPILKAAIKYYLEYYNA